MAWGDSDRIDRLERRGDRLEEMVLELIRLNRDVVTYSNKNTPLLEKLVDDQQALIALVEGINDNSAEVARLNTLVTQYEADQAELNRQLGGMVADTQATEDLINEAQKGEK